MDTFEQQATGLIANQLGGEPREKIVERENHEPEDEARRALVKQWAETVRADRDFWEERAFKRMRASQKLAAGKQWPHPTDPKAQADFLADDTSDRYVANIILRHIRNRTAALYGKNPKTIARRRKRIMNTIWDGQSKSLMEAVQTTQQMMSVGLPPDPMTVAILADAQKVLENNRKLDKVAETLQLLFEHEIEEQALPFKVQMKAMIRRALTTGVGYTKLGYQRVMSKAPEIEARMLDVSQKLATVERLSADIADGEIDPHAPEAETLRLMMADLAKTEDVLVREGLMISYPESTNIIPDMGMTQLRGFIGCDHVAEQYFLTKEKIQEIYGVEVCNAKAYVSRSQGLGDFSPAETGLDGDAKKKSRFCVWEIYDRTTQQVFVVCDGYPDFLTEPAAPDVYLERFFPWFPYVVNEVYEDERVFPPSDVELIAPMQLDLNRSRQSLREHRRAARPRTVARSGVLSDKDRDTITHCEANSVIELAGLAPQEKVEDVLQAWSGPQINPALYETNSIFEDVLRVSGGQEANFGGVSNATATETSIAEGSRMATVTSEIDDLDEFLNEFSRAAGQVLLAETSVETVRQVVGPGAAWPDLTRDEIAKEIYLEVEAASTGRPNKAQEVQNAQAIMPLLLQIPGLTPEWIARELIRRMDDRLDLSDAFTAGLPSIQALNRAGQVTAAPPQSDPNNQGAEGGGNAPGTRPAQVNAAARPPTHQPAPAPAA